VKFNWPSLTWPYLRDNHPSAALTRDRHNLSDGLLRQRIWVSTILVSQLFVLILLASSSHFLFYLTLYGLFVILSFEEVRRLVLLDAIRGLRGGLTGQENLSALTLGGLRHPSQHVILVIIVALKQLLHAVAAKLRFALLDCFSVLPLLVVDMICVEVVDVDVGYVRRLHPTRRQGVPVEIVEPRVLLQLFDTLCVANPVDGLALQTTVYEVCRLLVPAVRDPVLLDLNLPAKDLVADVLACATFVGSLSHHALVRDHAHGEVVRSQTVVLSAHHFGRHVAWSAARLTGVVRRENASHAEVCQAQVALVVKD